MMSKWNMEKQNEMPSHLLPSQCNFKMYISLKVQIPIWAMKTMHTTKFWERWIYCNNVIKRYFTLLLHSVCISSREIYLPIWENLSSFVVLIAGHGTYSKWYVCPRVLLLHCTQWYLFLWLFHILGHFHNYFESSKRIYLLLNALLLWLTRNPLLYKMCFWMLMGNVAKPICLVRSAVIYFGTYINIDFTATTSDWKLESFCLLSCSSFPVMEYFWLGAKIIYCGSFLR